MLNNLHDFLVAVANAIREKSGSNALINPQDFPNTIRNIKSSATNTTETTRYYKLDELFSNDYGMAVMLLLLTCNVESVIVDLADRYQGNTVKTTRFKLNSLYYSGRSEQRLTSAGNIMYVLGNDETLIAMSINTKDYILVIDQQNPDTLVYENTVLTFSGSLESRIAVICEKLLNMETSEAKQVANTMTATLNSYELTKEEYETLLTDNYGNE